MSPRTRVYAIVALAAAAAAAVAVAVAVVPSGGEAGGGEIARLRAVVAERPGDADARLRLGVALYEAGDRDAAEEQWTAVESQAADSPAALRAESLRHPEMAPNRPFFYPRSPGVARGESVADQLDDLKRRAEAGGAHEWIAYGVVLQRVGRPVSARRAFDRALELAPDELDAQVAAAVGRFDKDNPSAAFSRLGPLARDHPDAGVVRFHLGLLLLWLREVDEARRQLDRAVTAEPGSIYGREARDLLARLDKVRT